MATVGVRRAWVARVDENFKVITGIDGINGDASDKEGTFLIDESTSYGVASANITNLQGSLADIYGSNKNIYKSAAKGNVQTVLTVNHLPAEVKQRLIGNKSDGRGGFSITGKSDSNNRIALLVESADAFDEAKPLYVGFFGAVVTEPSQNMATNNASENRTTDALTFGHIERGDEGFGKFYFSWLPNFSKDSMISDIFQNGSSTTSSVVTPTK